MKNFLLSLFLLIFLQGFSQIYDPVDWSSSVEKVSGAENEYTIIFSAEIEKGWHLYAQNVPEGGPIPTTFSFGENQAYEIIGQTEEEQGKTVDDPVFGMRIKFFENEASFRQTIKLLKETAEIEASVEFMVCDDERCLPPEVQEFSISVPAGSGIEASADPNIFNSTAVGQENPDTTEVSNEEAQVTNKVETGFVADNEGEKGLWGIFLVAFLSGFAALLTPCVFPMIPMTVSYFTKQSQNRAKGIRNALIYGISIVVIYVLLGSAVTAIFGADSLNALATNVWFNLAFFIILVVFAISFFGAFDIMLPNSWANKVDSQADRGGIIGIFFMALALAIVSFSCTGPIVGTLLVQAASTGGLAPIVGMLGFSLAIALPFALFAAFPGWLNSLPRSGGWLNTVKVFLGFLELALAFKFLSQADLVLQLHLLEREVFIAIWIAIFGTLAFYLFGKIRLPHDSPLEHISVGRMLMGLLVLTFTIYLIPGLWGAPLNLISAFPPPLEYSESPYGVGYSRNSITANSDTNAEIPEGAHLLPPHDILAFNDYEKGMAYARKVNKPVMLDFTGWACVNCRKMEQNVWPKQHVLDILKNDIVLISLYVDDKRDLPEDEVYTSETTGKEITTVGEKWSDFQISRFEANAQPFYVLLNTNGKKLSEPAAYTPDPDEYYEWLQEGISGYKE
ncbi:protein-disulfide reductase DsbD family protein [Autumnicola musiva]|uniref:Cytochrome c biogenesis protein CcdA n=1 Tax=Autumnicola musiva TaxID=3075589 RepID=A0ABU3D2N2_9FLAO|nr:cytochrome c biogenesis protein CcdA [Zunongwangia sp. F117]MDT0675273.1 cytochrome c biogenesis protein CcdA [Zunongwangia sp. F117]